MYRPRHIDSAKTKSGKFQYIIFILVILLVVFILLESPFFEVKKFIVTGNAQLSEQEIVQLSCFSPGDNIFKINTQGAAQNIELAPLVKSVHIKRRLPCTVELIVEEREGVGLVAVANGFLVVDDEGIYLKEGQIGASQLPVITGLNATAPPLGAPLEASGIEEALDVICDIEPQYLPLISEIHMATQQQFYIYSIDGTQGYLGEPVEISSKLQLFFSVAEQLAESSPGAGIEYIDLSSKGWPVVQMKEGQR